MNATPPRKVLSRSLVVISRSATSRQAGVPSSLRLIG